MLDSQSKLQEPHLHPQKNTKTKQMKQTNNNKKNMVHLQEHE